MSQAEDHHHQQLESTVRVVRHEPARRPGTTNHQFHREFFHVSLPGVEGIRVVQHTPGLNGKTRAPFLLNGMADIYLAYAYAKNVNIEVEGETRKAEVAFIPFICVIFHGQDEKDRHYWMNDPDKSKKDLFYFEWQHDENTIARVNIARTVKSICRENHEQFPLLAKCLQSGPYAKISEDVVLRKWDGLIDDYNTIRNTILSELL